MTGLDDAVTAIRGGGVVVVPTDTVYGVVCDPADAAAVERIYEIKRRPETLELTVLCADPADVEDDVELTSEARLLAGAYWPGPLSMVMRVRGRRWEIPRTGRSLSCRVPNHALMLELLHRTGPLASTSANRHGQPAAVSAMEARVAFGADIDIVLDGGTASGRPSTIIDCTTTPPRVLRDGPITTDELLSRLGAGHPTEGQRQR
jgi:tRNA threonylcarbamoyl adenosine modification protein (Sua5/YciO/YrdC/YwlC family)